MLNGLAKVFMSKAEVRTECGQEAPEPMEVPLFKLKPVQIKVFQTQALDQGSVGPGGGPWGRTPLVAPQVLTAKIGRMSLSNHQLSRDYKNGIGFWSSNI